MAARLSNQGKELEIGYAVRSMVVSTMLAPSAEGKGGKFLGISPGRNQRAQLLCFPASDNFFHQYIFQEFVILVLPWTC